MTKHAEIAARLAAATPGPWECVTTVRVDAEETCKPVVMVDQSETEVAVVVADEDCGMWGDNGNDRPTADFIAHAPSDIAFLLDENRGLREAAHVGAELDNHHNAAMCPYCQAPLATAKDEITRLEAELALERARNRNAGKDYAEQSELLAAAEAEIATLREALHDAKHIVVDPACEFCATPTATAREGGDE